MEVGRMGLRYAFFYGMGKKLAIALDWRARFGHIRRDV